MIRRLTQEKLRVMIEKHRGDVDALAKELGIHRSTAYEWLAEEGISPATYK